MIICNEEGLLKGLPGCCDISGVKFVGTIIFTGIKENNFADIPCGFRTFKQLFPTLWEV